MTARRLIDHYDITDDDSCDCHYCGSWNRQRDIFERKRMLFEARRCKCKNCTANPENTIWLCLNYQKAKYELLAAANRRELIIEMSYHATFGDEQDGEELMEWVDGEVRNSKKGDGWWALHAERLTMDDWFVKFDRFARNKSRSILRCESVSPN